MRNLLQLLGIQRAETLENCITEKAKKKYVESAIKSAIQEQKKRYPHEESRGFIYDSLIYTEMAPDGQVRARWELALDFGNGLFTRICFSPIHQFRSESYAQIKDAISVHLKDSVSGRSAVNIQYG